MNPNNPDYIPPAGQNLGNVPGPTPPSFPNQDVGIRTMSGDVNSLQASGGLEVGPKTFRPKDLLGNEPAFMPQQAQQTPPISPQLPPVQPKGAHTKALIISIIVVALVAGAGAAAYFFVLPLFQKEEPAQPETCPEGQTGTPPDCVTPPPPEPVAPVEPTPPPTPETCPEGQTGTPPDCVTPPPPPPAFEHKTIFPASANVTSLPIVLANITLGDVGAAIKTALESETMVPVLKEMVFSSGGVTVDSAKLLPAYLPALNTEFIKVKVAQDFTAFAYKDKDGVWPGYVFQLNPEDPPTQNKSEMFSLVEQASLKFYVDDPGAPKAADFKDGANLSPNTKSVRYLQYTKPGASFNIAWVVKDSNNYMVVSTSYNGIKEAVKVLGF